jgi:hypothetical protein
MSLDKPPAAAGQDMAPDAAPQPEHRPPCCEALARVLAPCSQHPDPFDCSDAVIVSLSDGRIGMPIRDGGRSCFLIAFCPFCGELFNEVSGPPPSGAAR